MTTAYLNRISTAVPEHDVHDAFVVFAENMLTNPRLRSIFRRMAGRAEIKIAVPSWSVFSSHDAHKFYRYAALVNEAVQAISSR